MNAVAKVFLYAYRQMAWVLLLMGGFVFFGGRLDAYTLVSPGAWGMGLMCTYWITIGNEPWEQMLMTMPVDRKKLLLGRYLLGAAGAAAVSLLYSLGYWIGEGNFDLGYSLELAGYVLLMTAVGIPLYSYNGNRRSWAHVLFYAGSLTVCSRLPEGEKIVVQRNNDWIVEQLQVPLGTGVIFLAIAILVCVVSYFFAVRLDSEREW